MIFPDEHRQTQTGPGKLLQESGLMLPKQSQWAAFPPVAATPPEEQNRRRMDGADSAQESGGGGTAAMQARSALFDLYGDYLRPRGGRAPVASLVRLLAPLGIAAPAVRTAVSRMVRQGWLHPLRMSSGPGYLLTPKAARRLDEAAARIYRTHRMSWDGSFDLVIIDAPGARPERLRLGQNLAFL